MKKLFCLFSIVMLCTYSTVIKNYPTQGKAMPGSIKTVVIPAAGLGSRLLPGTKAIPKEMFPILNKPAIHFVVEEALTAGISDVAIITSDYKQSMEAYLSTQEKFNAKLVKNKKFHLISELEDMIQKASFNYILQDQPLGLGHAILLAKEHVGNNFFAVILPDDIIRGEQPELSYLMKIAQEKQASVITVKEVPKDSVSSYGVVSIKEQLSDNLFEIDDVVEKPSVEDAPSNLIISGHYIFSPSLFDSLEKVAPAANGELYPTDAMLHMMREKGEKIYAYKLQGTRYDVGVPEGILRATVDMALENPKYKAILQEMLAGKL